MDATQPSRPAILLCCSADAASQALAAILDHAHYRVIVARNEDEALDALQATAVELILVHLRGTDAAGLDFVKLQRMSDPVTPLVPVVVLADVMSAAVEQACADARVDLRLTSPIEPRYLVDYIADLRASRSRA